MGLLNLALADVDPGATVCAARHGCGGHRQYHGKTRRFIGAAEDQKAEEAGGESMKGYLKYCLIHWALWMAFVLVLCLAFDDPWGWPLLIGGTLTQQRQSKGEEQ